MEYNSSLKKLHGVETLKDVVPNIIDWDLSPLEGKGFFRKTQDYGHIEITIKCLEGVYSSLVVWNVDETKIPLELRDMIRDHVNFYYNLIIAIKGRIQISFEITGGSYHPVDSFRYGFPHALAYAIKNCFDKTFTTTAPGDASFIKMLQHKALLSLIERNAHFSVEEILTSLKDVRLNEIVKSLLSARDYTNLNSFISHFKYDVAGDYFTSNLTDEIIDNLIAAKILSKHKYFTYIGLAHLAIIFKDIYLLMRVGIEDFSPLYGYYGVITEYIDNNK